MKNPKFKLNQRFKALKNESVGNIEELGFVPMPLGTYEVIDIVYPGCNVSTFCSRSFIEPVETFSYVMRLLNEYSTFNIYTIQILEEILSDETLWNKVTTRWKEYAINKKEVSTAIFNYLENNGFNVNRKSGIYRDKYGKYIAKVEDFDN